MAMMYTPEIGAGGLSSGAEQPQQVQQASNANQLADEPWTIDNWHLKLGNWFSDTFNGLMDQYGQNLEFQNGVNMDKLANQAGYATGQSPQDVLNQIAEVNERTKDNVARQASDGRLYRNCFAC